MKIFSFGVEGTIFDVGVKSYLKNVISTLKISYFVVKLRGVLDNYALNIN